MLCYAVTACWRMVFSRDGLQRACAGTQAPLLFCGRCWRRGLCGLCLHTRPGPPLIPQPHLSIHADTHFDDALRFPARNTGDGLWHVAFPFPGERLPAADSPVLPPGEDVLQGCFGQRTVGRFGILWCDSELAVVLGDEFR